MKIKLTPYRIGDFITRSVVPLILEDNSMYKRVTIKTKGQGISVRDEKAGTNIGTKNQFYVYENQFLLSKIDAQNGAFGIVPNSCHDAIVTGNFWAYDINSELISIQFLEHLCRAEIFTSISKKSSEGTTNRRYLREDKFLDFIVHLPEISEQEKVIVLIDEVHKAMHAVDLKLKYISALPKSILFELFEHRNTD